MNTITKQIALMVFVPLLLVSHSLQASNVDYAALYEKVSESVVTIKTGTVTVSNAGFAMTPGLGSGILIEPQLIMTAAHVIDNADLVAVRFKDGTEIGATVVASVDKSDVALLRLEEPHPDPVMATLGDSDTAKTGSNVFIIGAPYGIEQTLSVGILSGRMSRGNMLDGTSIDYLQTDASINPGNSGGPMFNTDGEVVGVVSFIMSNGGGFDGVGYASAINSARKSVFESTAFIAGFDGIQLSDKIRTALGFPTAGFLVEQVIDGSIAEEFGLKAGSIPATIGGEELTLGGDIIVEVSCGLCDVSIESMTSVTDGLTNNLTALITVIRNGETITLSRMPESYATARLASWHQGHPGL